MLTKKSIFLKIKNKVSGLLWKGVGAVLNSNTSIFLKHNINILNTLKNISIVRNSHFTASNSKCSVFSMD